MRAIVMGVLALMLAGCSVIDRWGQEYQAQFRHLEPVSDEPPIYSGCDANCTIAWSRKRGEEIFKEYGEYPKPLDTVSPPYNPSYEYSMPDGHVYECTQYMKGGSYQCYQKR